MLPTANADSYASHTEAQDSRRVEYANPFEPPEPARMKTLVLGVWLLAAVVITVTLILWLMGVATS